MSNDPAFLFYPGDYLRDTQCFSEKVQVAYDRIMCEHMRNICITQQQLNFFTKRLSPEEKEELAYVLVRSKDGFQIKWVAESIVKRRAYSKSRRINRTKHMSNICKTYDEHMENENVNENKDKDKLLFLEFVKLTQTQHDDLIAKIGKNGTEDYIQRLNNYIGAKGKQYKSHYHAILSWWRKDGSPANAKDRAERQSQELKDKYGDMPENKAGQHKVNKLVASICGGGM